MIPKASMLSLGEIYQPMEQHFLKLRLGGRPVQLEKSLQWLGCGPTSALETIDPPIAESDLSCITGWHLPQMDEYPFFSRGSIVEVILFQETIKATIQ